MHSTLRIRTASLSNFTFLLPALVGIAFIIGPISIFAIFIEQYLNYVTELLRIVNHVCEVKEANELEQRERERNERARKRSVEISLIASAVATRLEAITAKESSKLDAARAQFHRQHGKNVARISSKVLEYIINNQAEALSKERMEIKLATDGLIAARTSVEMQRRYNESYEAQLQLAMKAARDAFDALQAYIKPVSFLSLNPNDSNFTCIGTTKENQRCRLPTGPSRYYASSRLDQLRSGELTKDYPEEKLVELANWMLCPRWHRDNKPQGPQIARMWYLELQEFYRTHSAMQNVQNTLSVLEGVTKAVEQSPYRTPASSRSSIFSSSGFSTSGQSISPWSPPSSVSSDGTGLMGRNAQDNSYFNTAPANLMPRFQELAQKMN